MREAEQAFTQASIKTWVMVFVTFCINVGAMVALLQRPRANFLVLAMIAWLAISLVVTGGMWSQISDAIAKGRMYKAICEEDERGMQPQLPKRARIPLQLAGALVTLTNPIIGGVLGVMVGLIIDVFI